MASKLVLLAVLVACASGYRSHFLTREHGGPEHDGPSDYSLPDGCHWVCNVSTTGGEIVTFPSTNTSEPGSSTSSPEITSSGGENSTLTTLENSSSTSHEGNTTETGENSSSITEGSSSPRETSSEPSSGDTTSTPRYCNCLCNSSDVIKPHTTPSPGDDRKHYRQHHNLYHPVVKHLRHHQSKHHGRPETKHHEDQNKNHGQERHHRA